MEQAYFFDTTPHGNELTFIGTAGLSRRRKDAVEAALRDATRKVAFFHGVGGEIVYHESGGPLVGGATIGKKVLRDAGDYSRYMADLHFDPLRDVLVTDRAVFVRTTYESPKDMTVSYTRPRSGVKPNWVTGSAEIQGYSAAVGFATHRAQYKNTVIASYEDAVFALLESELFKMDAIESQIRGTMNMSSLSYSAGTVYGFYVLDTWTDPETLNIWTLAIAQDFDMELLL
jgi:hypothetical protein